MGGFLFRQPYYAYESIEAPETPTDVPGLLLTLDSNMARRPAFRAWVGRELERGNVGSDDLEGLTAVARGLDRLRSRGQALDFQRLSWHEVESRVSVPSPWTHRIEVYRYADGWTLDGVREEDLAEESRQMGNCAWRLAHLREPALMSLRDPDRRSHASVWMLEGFVFEILGRAGEVNLKPQYGARVREYINRFPGSSWYWYNPEEDRPEPDQFGLLDGRVPLGEARAWFASFLSLS